MKGTTNLSDPYTLDPPVLHLGIGITGHRGGHPVFAAHRGRIEAVVARVMDQIDALVAAEAQNAKPCTIAQPRLYSLLANGADLMTVGRAQARGWRVAAPLPFGLALNIAVNALPATLVDAEALLSGATPRDADTADRAQQIRVAAAQADLFMLAEQDAQLTPLFLQQFDDEEGGKSAQAFAVEASNRAAVAGRIMVEQSDLVIGIWDGVTQGMIGGTRHSIAASLSLGVPVLWIDVNAPEDWRILSLAESLAMPKAVAMTDRDAQLAAIIRDAIRPDGIDWQAHCQAERWRPRNNPFAQAYRRVEAVFGADRGQRLKSMTQHYEHPDAIAEGSAKPLMDAARALPGVDAGLVDYIAAHILRPFAWADGVSTRLSDAYRGGMVSNFLLSAFAIIGGMAYLPFAGVEQKWIFAVFEFILLAAIIAITFTGRKRRWHGRWFETRRLAEYFRHAPILLLTGVARSSGRWPRGPGFAWPEWFGIHAINGFGLPRMEMTTAYLRASLALIRDCHVLPQSHYHGGKAQRLRRTQTRLDHLSEILFMLAVVSVAGYLVIVALSALGMLPSTTPAGSAKLFTFLGVLLPTLGGAMAGIHYFGDFDRFASISEIAQEKLDGIAARIDLLAAAPDAELTYARVSDLAHAVDDVVITEIESWQAVFGAKHFTVPV